MFQSIHYVITIDGPAASGKSTVAKLLANELGFLYLDSGAFYRTITLYMIYKKLLDKNETLIKRALQRIKIDYVLKVNPNMFLNGKNVTREIRSSIVNKSVSEVSTKRVVREEVNKRLKKLARSNSVVIDGRDIGTKVFKDANLKIYLTASSSERAKRRLKDLKRLKEKIVFKKVFEEIKYRDYYDSSRAISPLSKAHDSVVIDSTDLGIKEVLNKICFFSPDKFTLFV